MNPLANELGRSRIQRKYQDDGRYFASVELVEGKQADRHAGGLPDRRGAGGEGGGRGVPRGGPAPTPAGSAPNW